MPNLKWNDVFNKNIIAEVQLAKLNKNIHFLHHENNKSMLLKSRNPNFPKNKNFDFNCSLDFGI